MGRPTIMFQRLVIPASTLVAGLPGQIIKTDPTFFSAPEAVKVDYLFIDSEQNNSGDFVVRPALHERQFWVEDPVLPSNYNNYPGRNTDGDDYGEWKLQEPFLAVRGHGIAIEIQNAMAQLTAALMVQFHGVGRQSGKEYSLRFDCDMPAGAAGGVRQTFGGRGAYVAGEEDVWIKAVTWARKPGNPTFPGAAGWNPRLISMLIKPGYGVKWSGPGGGGAGGSFIPLIVMSNIRGPQAACMYRPSKDLLEQNDVFTLECMPFTPNNGANALIALVCTTIAD